MRDRGLLEFLMFNGQLEAGGNSAPVRFRARIDLSGNVEFDFDALSLTQETRFILQWRNEGKEKFREKFRDLVESIRDVMWAYYIDEDKAQFSNELLEEFLASATTFKHVGFKEEREVRIVAFPTSYSLKEEMRALGADAAYLAKPLKQINNRGKRSDVLYIRLFEFNDHPTLPIKRIIVGPHKSQAELARRVEALVGSKIPVTCSETPYIGRSV
jgi:hypothetical protein